MIMFLLEKNDKQDLKLYLFQSDGSAVQLSAERFTDKLNKTDQTALKRIISKLL